MREDWHGRSSKTARFKAILVYLQPLRPDNLADSKFQSSMYPAFQAPRLLQWSLAELMWVRKNGPTYFTCRTPRNIRLCIVWLRSFKTFPKWCAHHSISWTTLWGLRLVKWRICGIAGWWGWEVVWICWWWRVLLRLRLQIQLTPSPGCLRSFSVPPRRVPAASCRKALTLN